MNQANSKTTDPNNNLNDEKEREKMVEYWNKHSKDCSIQEMMLDTNAEVISDQELPEILTLLPDYSGLDLLELGAGIGRFTKEIAKNAKSVIAVDFIEDFIEKNREENSHLGNIEFAVGDATKISYSTNQFDMIFTNWLLMYLSDSEIKDLVGKSLSYIKTKGYFFVRESCFHPSGNIKNLEDVKKENPTVYRSPKAYLDLFLSEVMKQNDTTYGFELVFARPNRTYINMKSNSNQFCFLFKKVKLNNFKGFKTLQEFFDARQYTRESILQYERIYGPTHVCPGGHQSTELFFGNLDLKPGQKILNIGCGIGGSAFYVSQKYDVEVYGMDLSSNMIKIAWDRLQALKHSINRDVKVRFEIGDVTKYYYPNEYFDFIISRDVILHIPNKKDLLSRINSWLKPGGKVLVTDYTCAPEPWSDEFNAYVESRGYSLVTIEDYVSLFRESGFKNVTGDDKTDLFLTYSEQEKENFEKLHTKEGFLKEFGAEQYNYLLNSWKEKIARTRAGHQRYGVFSAEKSTY